MIVYSQEDGGVEGRVGIEVEMVVDRRVGEEETEKRRRRAWRTVAASEFESDLGLKFGREGQERWRERSMGGHTRKGERTERLDLVSDG